MLVGAAPALAKDTISVRLTDEAETASAAKPKALVSWAQDKAGHRHEVDMQPYKVLPQKHKCNVEVLSQECKLEHHPNEGKCKPVWLP